MMLIKNLTTVLGNRVLLSIPEIKKEEEQKTKGGLYLPSSVEKDTLETVEAKAMGVGKDCEAVKSGDLVLFVPSKQMKPISIDGNAYLIVEENSIIGIR